MKTLLKLSLESLNNNNLIPNIKYTLSFVESHAF